ncbi:polyprenyl synthetase family protein [Lentzea sp. NPDC059081]|uniref:polyprenyl synthetase family protein n=1 Tax=Lentzea sp. NPDC059081 TaxID=3346719 RepID=UPI00369F6E85
MTTVQTIREPLRQARELVLSPLRDQVDGLPPATRRLVRHHFGWTGAGTGAVGKLLRPALTLACAEAVGGTAREAVPAAVAVELVHNFSLIHDDLIDQDATRRHRPTVWHEHGTAAAVLAGNALLALGIGTVAGSGPPGGQPVLVSAVQEMIVGQLADSSFEHRADVTREESLLAAEGKTGALMGAACALGALSGGGDTTQAEHLRTFGRHLGIAFQAADDLLGIWGDPALTGKPVGADLVVRKKSLPVVAALTSGTPAGAELAARYHREDPYTAEDVRRSTRLVVEAGGRAWCERQAVEHLALADQALQAVAPGQEAAGKLAGLTALVVGRDH